MHVHVYIHIDSQKLAHPICGLIILEPLNIKAGCEVNFLLLREHNRIFK